MGVYTYQRTYFMIEVLATGSIALAAAVVCPVLAFRGVYPAIMAIFALAGCYQAWNTFVAIANPESVTLDDGSISFSAWGRTDAYRLDQVSQLRIREFPSAGKMYVRINRSSILKGRYWLQTRLFSNGEELFCALRDLEYRLHPDSLKARARRVNTAYLKAERRAHEKTRGTEGDQDDV